MNGGTVSLAGAQINVGTIHLTGDPILDFNSVGTFLSSAALVIDTGVTVTINKWRRLNVGLDVGTENHIMISHVDIRRGRRPPGVTRASRTWKLTSPR